MKKIDLHIHTTASDGKLTPEEIVVRAEEKEFQVIAITDHDSIAGVEEAIRAGGKIGIKVIPAIEISTAWQGGRVHMLGYGIDVKNKVLAKELEKFRKERKRRAKKIAEKLTKLGFKIHFSDIIEGAHDSIGRPHVADTVLTHPENRALLKEKMDRGKFIEKYLIEGKPAFVPKKKINTLRSIKLIHQVGGQAVWAHPAYYTKSRQKINQILKEFKRAGLDGLEVFYRDHTKEDVKLLHALAQKFNLCQTAGSDFHDPKVDKLGGFKTFGYSLDKVRDFAEKL